MNLGKFLIPLLLIPLLLLTAAPAVRAYSGHYYVIPSSISLRECAANDCAPLLTVYQGEKVEILERTGTGWSKVRLVERSAMGWIRSNLLSYSPDLKGVVTPPYYVNTNRLPLRDKPKPNANVVTTLSFRDAVEMLGVGASGWAQIRDLRSSAVGYVDPRYLSSTPPGSPKSSSRRRSPARKAAPKKEKAPEEAPATPAPM